MSDDLLRMLMSMDDSADVRENQVQRAPFKYPGCKEKSAQHIIPRLPYRNGYCEPFGGSGIILMRRRESNLEIYNDRFGGVTSFYKCLQHPLKHIELMRRLEFTIHSREMFVWARDTWDTQDVYDDIDRAVRWWYMHQVSFGGKDKSFGRCTSGKAQMGAALKNNLQWFEPVHRRLVNVQIENQDWRQLFKDYDSEDMVWYLDPTYLGCGRGNYKHELKVEEHHELCDRLMKLKGFVALSGFYNNETREVYSQHGWSGFHSWEVSTAMNGFAFTDTNHLEGRELSSTRGKALEALWWKE